MQCEEYESFSTDRHLVQFVGVRSFPSATQLIFETLDGFYLGRLSMYLRVTADLEACPVANLWQKLTGSNEPTADALQDVFAEPLQATVEKLERKNKPALIAITDLHLVE